MTEQRNRRTRRRIGHGAGQYKKYTTWSVGDFIIGELIKTDIDRTYNKPYYTIKLEEFSFENPKCTRPLDTLILEGMELTLNSAGTLDHRMEEVNVGDVVEIVYNGEEPLPADHKFKNKMAHQFDVFILEDNDSENSDVVDL